MKKELAAGAASVVANCAVGDGLAGQLHRRVCRGIRDDLEANLLYLSDGAQAVILVSLDLVDLEGGLAGRLAKRIAKETGVPAGDIIIACTHTHTGPTTYPYIAGDSVNTAYLDGLEEKLASGARSARDSALPARIGWGVGRAHIGFNRRVCMADGTHHMYGDTRKPGFTGLEGPDDPSHAVLFAVDGKGRVIGVVHNNTCHATCIESAEVASADYPGEARRLIRGELGAGTPVLYFQGAAGDTSPWNLLEGRGRDGEARLREIGALLAAETLRLVKSAETRAEVVLRLAAGNVKAGLRHPDPAELERARRIVGEGEGSMEEYDKLFRYQIAKSLLRLDAEYRGREFEEMAIHSVRVGDMALTTSPTELYCRYGLDIKKGSPAGVTMVVELANGYSGYCPTPDAIRGGGYSGETSLWTRLAPDAGELLVGESLRQLSVLWAA